MHAMKAFNKYPGIAVILAALALVAGFFSSVSLAGAELPDPDGKPAEMSKPVQVFILLGQSNMLGFGRVAGNNEGP